MTKRNMVAAIALFLIPFMAQQPVLADGKYEISGAQWYFSVGIGANSLSDVIVESRSNDRASICDEYINPLATTLSSCTTPNRGVGDGWLAPFGSGSGFSTEVDFGFHLSPRFRLAAVYTYNATNFDQTVSSTDATGTDFDKISNELSIGEETLGSLTANGLSIFVYHDWRNGTKWTPYAGIGTSLSRSKIDFSWLWARSINPEHISTGLDQPNAEQIRRNLAGTVSAGRRTLRDMMQGHALALGIDRELSDTVSMGLKLQWHRLSAFKSGAYAGDLLRSHSPNLRLDGNEPVSTWSRIGNSTRFSARLTLRYTNR